jgi:hypothetical protein
MDKKLQSNLIIETLKELKLEIEIIKEKQKKMIKKMNVLIKKTNNMCFVYSSDSHNSNDDDDNYECSCGSEPQKEDIDIVDYLNNIKMIE